METCTKCKWCLQNHNGWSFSYLVKYQGKQPLSKVLPLLWLVSDLCHVYPTTLITSRKLFIKNSQIRQKIGNSGAGIQPTFFLFKLCESPLNISYIIYQGKETISVAKGPQYYRVTEYPFLRDFKKIVEPRNFEIP